MTTVGNKSDDFREAVMKRLADLEESLTWLGGELGVTRQAAQQWMSKPPGKDRVEQIEEVLGIPGQLCRILGYATQDHDPGPRATFADVVNADPLLSNRDRRALLDLYRALTGH